MRIQIYAAWCGRALDTNLWFSKVRFLYRVLPSLFLILIPFFLPLYSSLYYHMTGSFAVICLMVASVCEREVAKMSFDPSPATNGSVPTTAPSGLWSEVDAMKLKIAISLACLIGIIQVI